MTPYKESLENIVGKGEILWEKETIVGKGENAGNTFNLDQPKMLSYGKELTHSHTFPFPHNDTF